MLEIEERMKILSLCGILDRLVAVASAYRERYAALLSSARSSRLERLVEGLEAVEEGAGRVKSRICGVEEPSLPDIRAAGYRIADLYSRAVYGEPPLPASVKTLLYEAYVILRELG